MNLHNNVKVDLIDKYADFVRSLAKNLGTIAEDLHHATTGCATEAGEALSTTKKMWIYGQGVV